MLTCDLVLFSDEQ